MDRVVLMQSDWFESCRAHHLDPNLKGQKIMMKKIWERIVPLEKADRSFDIAFWQAQSASRRFAVAFDMLKDNLLLKGEKINAHTFRLQRTVERLKQAQG